MRQRFGADAIFTGAPVGPAMLPPIAASIFLARHGQTAYNLERRFQGQQPVPLDDTGRGQAAELAERAAEHGFAALWCSPLLRARETADVVAQRLGLEPKEDARLMETDAGDWTDRSFEDVRALTHPVLRHRIITNFHAQSEGITTDILVDRLLEAVPLPRSGM